MDPLIPKAVWGFNGTERPGAVYLAAVLAGAQPEGPAGLRHLRPRRAGRRRHRRFPADVQAKLLQFARAGLAAATMRGKSYLAMGGVSMGIAGSIVDQEFFEDYLGMRVETVDMTEFVRRMDEGIYDQDEYERALPGSRENCPEGQGPEPAGEAALARAEGPRTGRPCVKMALIARDLMVGNPRLAEMGFARGSARATTRSPADSRASGSGPTTSRTATSWRRSSCTSFDWNGIRQPYIVATENDALNGASMLFGHLLTGTAQLFADVRTYWSPEAVKRVTGHTLDRAGRRRHPPPDQLRPRRAGLDRRADRATASRR